MDEIGRLIDYITPEDTKKIDNTVEQDQIKVDNAIAAFEAAKERENQRQM
ncbi:MAG: hypothetical protein IMF12_02860 [Proteobacteria bacterium]|nr:hypothetical protein [Pseudomonadota bacterium]